MHESFRSQNIFRDSKKIFCDFSVGSIFSAFFMLSDKSFIDQASSVKRAGNN